MEKIDQTTGPDRAGDETGPNPRENRHKSGRKKERTRIQLQDLRRVLGLPEKDGSDADDGQSQG